MSYAGTSRRVAVPPKPAAPSDDPSHTWACKIPAPVAVPANGSARDGQAESNGFPTHSDGRPDFVRMDVTQRLAYHRKRLSLGI